MVKTELRAAIKKRQDKLLSFALNDNFTEAEKDQFHFRATELSIVIAAIDADTVDPLYATWSVKGLH